MLSGKSFEVPLGNVRSVFDLKCEITILMFDYCKKPKGKLHQLQLVNDTTILENYGRAITTDETILTAIICKK